MSPEEAERVCDRLHEYVDRGPGENPDAFSKALAAVRSLRADASSDYPLSLLAEIETQLGRWFSDRVLRGTDEALECRRDLLDHISRLEDAWDRLVA